MATLIIEDGTGVAGANSFISVADGETILDNLGYSFDAALTDDEKSQFLIRSAAYLETFRASYSGCKKTSTQGLQWPRIDACIDNFSISSSVVPYEIQQAQALGAYYESIGKSLQAVTDGKEIASKKVAGAVEVSYFQNGQVHKETTFNDIDSLIKPLFKNGGQFMVHRI